MCSPHYSHVMVNSSKGSLSAMDSTVARGPGGGFPAALASAAPEPGMWEIMVSRRFGVASGFRYFCGIVFMFLLFVVA